MRPFFLFPPDGKSVAYACMRHIGFVLDEMCEQGLIVWQDETRNWHWKWMNTKLVSEKGFWALGEAVLDAAVARYPEIFNTERQPEEP